VVDDLVSGVNAIFNEGYGMYEVPCDIKFQWNAVIGGHKFGIHEANAIFELPGTGNCFLAFDTYPVEYHNFSFGEFLICKLFKLVF
jgi:hypothetical protein